jgi:hypothetical protein
MARPQLEEKNGNLGEGRRLYAAEILPEQGPKGVQALCHIFDHLNPEDGSRISFRNVRILVQYRNLHTNSDGNETSVFMT